MEYKGYGIVDSGNEFIIYKNGEFQAKRESILECQNWIDEKN